MSIMNEAMRNEFTDLIHGCCVFPYCRCIITFIGSAARVCQYFTSHWRSWEPACEGRRRVKERPKSVKGEKKNGRKEGWIEVEKWMGMGDEERDERGVNGGGWTLVKPLLQEYQRNTYTLITIRCARCIGVRQQCSMCRWYFQHFVWASIKGLLFQVLLHMGT